MVRLMALIVEELSISVQNVGWLVVKIAGMERIVLTTLQRILVEHVVIVVAN